MATHIHGLMIAALELIQSCAIAASGVELRALTVTGREVSMPPMAPVYRQLALFQKQAAAVGRACRDPFMGQISTGATVPVGCAWQPAVASVRS